MWQHIGGILQWNGLWDVWLSAAFALKSFLGSFLLTDVLLASIMISHFSFFCWRYPCSCYARSGFCVLWKSHCLLSTKFIYQFLWVTSWNLNLWLLQQSIPTSFCRDEPNMQVLLQSIHLVCYETITKQQAQISSFVWSEFVFAAVFLFCIAFLFSAFFH